MKLLLGGACALAFTFAACGGGSSKSPTPSAATKSPAPAASASASAATRTPLAAASAAGGQATAAATAAGASPAAIATSAPPASTAAPSGAPPATLAQATALLDRILIKPPDLPPDWNISSDTSQDNAAAAAADPSSAASNTSCSRLLARTITNMPADVVGTFISGKTVSYFSTATVYATAAGAAQCAALAAQKYTQPGQLARAFGTLFVSPDAVVVTPVSYPTVADGSFAATLAGKVNANGTIVDITLLIVGFRDGNVGAVVGAAANEAPPVAEVQPLVDLVVKRIGAG
jgi:hypothetical protein